MAYINELSTKHYRVSHTHLKKIKSYTGRHHFIDFLRTAIPYPGLRIMLFVSSSSLTVRQRGNTFIVYTSEVVPRAG